MSLKTRWLQLSSPNYYNSNKRQTRQAHRKVRAATACSYGERRAILRQKGQNNKKTGLWEGGVYEVSAITFLSEGLKALLPLPIPASIYGLLLMFFALKVGIVPLNAVQGAGDWLVEIMPLLFVPAAVGLLEVLAELRQFWLPFLVITLLSTLIVLAVSGKTAELLLNRKGGKQK